MELVVIFIMLLAGLSFLLKLTCESPLGRLTVCLLVAISVGLSWQWAVGQSKTRIADWLQNPELMLDMAVLLTIDVFMQISFCVLSAKELSGEAVKPVEKILRACLLWFPGILIFPALFVMLVQIIFAFPGMDFTTLAWSTAGAILVASTALPPLLKQAVPEPELRLELIFMINALIALLGVIATVNGRTAAKGTNSVEWGALLGIVIILAAGAAAGILLYKRKNNKTISHLK